MRILITADIHYDAARSRQPAEELAERVSGLTADALVLVGDTASADHQFLRDGLRLFDRFAGRKFLVPGNHCLWCLPGEDALDRYERIVPAIAAECGFTVLDHAPAAIDGVGLVGSIGWYDYSYRDESLGLPLDFYRAKIAPGAAERFPQHRPLLDKWGDTLTEDQKGIISRWMDGVHVRMAMSDEEFLDYLLDKLASQLEAMTADASVGRVVAFVHHLPFRQLLPPPDRILPESRRPGVLFASAYLGSDRIGEMLLRCPKLTHVYCGHSHWEGRLRVGSVEVINVASTYMEKKLEVLDL